MSRRLPPATVAALVGAGLAALGTFLTWFRIEIGGVVAPGGSESGWEGRDGRTVLGGAVVALLAAGLVALGRRTELAKVALLVSGCITAVVAVAGIVDASSKAGQVQSQFGIPPGRVVADVGAGLWLVAVAGAVQLAGGLLVRRAAR
ncbi:MAG: hypothetical protein H0W25_01230 [Acidimicrobiia bacterium]|nr:hypothetical protein [Acidimicrobiia bacterium]